MYSDLTITILAPGGSYANQADGSSFLLIECLDDGCYTLTVFDTYRNGLYCTYRQGSYTLNNASTANILAAGGSFNISSYHIFCLGSKKNSL